MRRHFTLCSIVGALLLASPLVAQVAVPEIPFDSTPNFLKMPDNIVMGEAVGVATNSKGHVFVFTRSGLLSYTVGTSRMFARGAASRLYEFDQNGNFVREIGVGMYSMAFAHTVRVDPQDNIWICDEGANMIIKLSPEGRVLMTLGRKPESFDGIPGPAVEGKQIGVPVGFGGGAAAAPAAPGAAAGGPAGGAGGGGEAANEGPFATFNRQTDVAWILPATSSSPTVMATSAW